VRTVLYAELLLLYSRSVAWPPPSTSTEQTRLHRSLYNFLHRTYRVIMASLGQLLSDNKFLKLQPSNKILCDVTGHEMSARADVVQAYISGKKFKKQLEWYKHDYSEFLPHIVEDKENAKQLYCKITKQTLNKIPDEVRKHMQGRRFQRYCSRRQCAFRD
jgi:hypothetical protein